jgi:hypothetical protein
MVLEDEDSIDQLIFEGGFGDGSCGVFSLTFENL